MAKVGVVWWQELHNGVYLLAQNLYASISCLATSQKLPLKPQNAISTFLYVLGLKKREMACKLVSLDLFALFLVFGQSDHISVSLHLYKYQIVVMF